MKKLFLPILCAFALMSCTGRQNNGNNTNLTINTPAVTENVGTDLSDENFNDKGIAFEIWKAIWIQKGLTVNETCPEDCTVEYSKSEELAEAFFVDDAVYCYPLKTGGWAAFLKHIEEGPGTAGIFSYESYTYKDGVLEAADFLPVVNDITELLATWKCEGHEAYVEALKALFQPRQEDFMAYDFDANHQTVLVSLFPKDLENEKDDNNWREDYWDLLRSVPYRWNGKAFEKIQPHTPLHVLSDKEGTKFLLIDYETTHPESLNDYKYIVYNGYTYPVVFKGYQEGDSDNNSGRDTYYNFENHPGWLFEMQEGQLLTEPKDEYDAIWDAPLLVDEYFNNTAKRYYLSDRLTDRPLSDELKTKIEKQFGWKILHGAVAYEFERPEKCQWIYAQFENKGDKALAMVGVVMPDGSLCVKEFPAAWNEESVWRVDDEGEFYGLGLDMVTEEDGLLTLYTYDQGAEGTNYQSYVVKGDSLCKGKTSASFYQAPE